jgi:hypothetical protein
MTRPSGGPGTGRQHTRGATLNNNVLAVETADAVKAATDENMKLKGEMDMLKKTIERLNGQITSATSGEESANDNVRIVKQKELNEGQRASVSAYVSSLFKRLKFLNNETLAAYPSVLQNALDQLVIVKSNETQANYKTATLKEMRYQLSQKRQYSKKQIMKKYIGK